jgi:hypothetical protein
VVQDLHPIILTDDASLRDVLDFDVLADVAPLALAADPGFLDATKRRDLGSGYRKNIRPFP